MNIAGWIRQRAFLEPDALITKEGEVACNNAEFYERMLKAAAFLRDKGIKPGDRVAVLLYNSSLFLELFFASAHLGAIFVPLNYRLMGEELEYIAGNCGCSILISDNEFKEQIKEVKTDTVSIMFAEQIEGGSYFLPMDEQGESGNNPIPIEADADMDTPMAILYTSGTTGRPKGATFSHGNILWNAIMLRIEGIGREKALLNAPLFHTGGLNATATQVIYGKGSLVIQRAFNPGQVLEIIEKEKITCVFGVPTMLDMIAREPGFEQTDFSSVRCLITGAAPLPVNLIKIYHNKDIMVRQAYGLTESTACILHDEYALTKQGSCGKEFFHQNIRIVDEQGRDVPRGEVGELIIKGPTVMLGYWGNPDATKETIKDGWLWTGDLGRRDEDGFLFIVDRKKDMIISGGENIYPAEVEAVLVKHSDIAEAAVVGVSDEKWGEIPIAVIVSESGSELNIDDLTDFCRSKMARYKVPKHFRFIEELPRNAAGKVNKVVLKDKWVDNEL